MENRDELSFGITDTFTNDDNFSDVIFGDVTTTEKPKPVEKEVKTETEVEAVITNDEAFDPLADVEDEAEVQDEVVTTQTEVETEDEEESEEVSDNIFKNFSQELYKLGFFTLIDGEDEPEIETPEQLLERVNKEKKIGAQVEIYNLLKEKHGQEGINTFQAIYINGVSPREYFRHSEEIKSFSELELDGEDNVENQKAVYREFFKRQGLGDDEIEKDLNREIQYGELEEKVKKYHPLIVKQEQKELAKLEQEAAIRNREIQEFENQYKNTVAQIISTKVKEKEFDGIPFTQKEAEALKDFTTNKKWELPSTGELLTDFDAWILELRKPENWEKRLKFALLAQNNLDLSKIKTKVLSEEKDQIFSSLQQKSKVVKRKQNTDIEDFLKGL